MAIFVDQNTKVIVQGLTGGQGRYHGLRNKAYGTQVVGGVTPGKAGQDVEGIPVFDTVADAVAATGATASFIAVPPKAAPAAILEAARAGIGFVVCNIAARLSSNSVAWPKLPRHYQPGKMQHRNYCRRNCPSANCGGAKRWHCFTIGNADISGVVRTEATGNRRQHLRRHWRRPSARNFIR